MTGMRNAERTARSKEESSIPTSAFESSVEQPQDPQIKDDPPAAAGNPAGAVSVSRTQQNVISSQLHAEEPAVRREGNVAQLLPLPAARDD
ncbi:unnamed protein product, partial [Amoebophrya sp. A120]|eukprot:GSA120T00009854001.1